MTALNADNISTHFINKLTDVPSSGLRCYIHTYALNSSVINDLTEDADKHEPIVSISVNQNTHKSYNTPYRNLEVHNAVTDRYIHAHP